MWNADPHSLCSMGDYTVAWCACCQNWTALSEVLWGVDCFHRATANISAAKSGNAAIHVIELTVWVMIEQYSQ